MSRIKFITLFCCLSTVLFADAWTPFLTIPEATNYKDGCFFGDFVSVGADRRPETANNCWVWTEGDLMHFHFELEEPRMAKVPMNIKEHDGTVWEDDTGEVFLYPTPETYYHFIFNPIGTRYDEKMDDKSWDCDWSVSVNRELYSWSADVTINLKDLGGKPADGTEWGMQVGHTRMTVGHNYAWAASPTKRFRDSRGVIRFGKENHPVARVAGTEKASQPQFVWSDDGKAPECRRAGIVPRSAEIQLHEFDFADVAGTVLYRTNLMLRCSQVKAILKDCVEALKDSEIPGDKMFLTEIAALESINSDESPELCLLLEEEARALRRRIEFRLNREKMSSLGYSEASIVFGVQNSLVRMRPVDFFTGAIGDVLKLDAAANEMEAGQVTIFGGETPLIEVQAKVVQPLTDEKGNAIPAEALRIRRIAQIMTCIPCYQVDYVGPTPDPLMPLKDFDVPAFGNETLWIDVKVPEGTAPGTYQGKIALKARNTDETLVPVTLRVRNFSIPKFSSIPSAFGVWKHKGYEAIDMWTLYEDAFAHRITPYFVCDCPPMLHKPYLELTEKDALLLKIDSKMAGTMMVALASDEKENGATRLDIPAGTSIHRIGNLKELLPGGRLYHLSLILNGSAGATLSATLERPQGKLELIPAATRAIASYKGELVDWPSWEFYAMDPPAVPAVVDWSQFDKDFERALSLGLTAHEAMLGRPQALWARLYREHLSEKGWLKYFYTYLADEPTPDDYPRVNNLLAPIKTIPGGDLMNMMTARSFPEQLGFVDTWCPETYTYDPELAAAEQAKNRNVWWYVAFGNRPPYPNVWMDSPIVETRSWLWQTWKHDLDGILYWSINWWLWRDPWRTGETFKISNGDGNFVYPDLATGKTISSIRWEVMMDGMEDYELFCILEAAKDEIGDRNPELAARIEKLLAINPEVCVSWKEYTRDAALLLAERARLMDCIEDVVAYLGHQPAIVKRPRRRSGLSQQEIQEHYAAYLASEEVRLDNVADQFQKQLAALETPAIQKEDGLALRYSFDEELPIIPDLSGNRMDTGRYGVNFTEGHTGRGVRVVSGEGLWLPAGCAIMDLAAPAGTISFWIKPEYSEAALLDKNRIPVLFYLMETDQNYTPSGLDEIGLYIQDGKLRARVGGTETKVMEFAAIDNPLKLKAWTHLAITWKDAERILYVDGKEAARRTDAFTAPRLDSYQGSLGTHSCTSTDIRTCEGVYDDLRIYKRALTAEEIQNLAR
ncbi:MAG: DUF6067 family protein [Lentisphaeria bacterium]|nr:DUF6067 family protein [Lentisphaeria bacterium]